MRGILVAAAIATGAVGTAAHAGGVRGTVFADDDGDGVLDAGEPGVATVVGLDAQTMVRTDAAGQFQVEAGSGGLLWARVPEGFVPGPAWAVAAPTDSDQVTVDLPLRRLPPGVAATPLTFVVAADTHLHFDQKHYGLPELMAAMDQATALDPPPRFFTVLGDVTQANQPEELDQIARAVDDLAVPWVPVAGNHDWYDGGLAWRATFGPETYSFDTGGAHFVVVNTTVTDEEVVAFLELDLGFVDPDATIVVLAHAPLDLPVIERMEARGVDLFLAGHWHTNRVVEHGELLELDTQPFLMGGMDFTPAGYRVVTIADGTIAVDHHTVVRAPQLRLAAPVTGRCVQAGESLVVAAAIDVRAVEVTARIGGTTLALDPVGGWGFAGAVPALSPGRHPVRLEARAGGRIVAERSVEVAVCRSTPAPLVVGASPQPGGSAAHLGRQDHAIAPPVVERWATAVGGPIAGTPVIAGGAVYVTVADLARGVAGGVVALDATTGAVRWRITTDRPVRSSPIVVGELVVVSRTDGTVLALDAATGAERWRHALGTGFDPILTTLFAAPAAADGVVYVGIQRRFVALDAATGVVRWSVDPVPDGSWGGTPAAAAIAGDLVVAIFERSRGGLKAWSRAGEPRWTVPPGSVVATSASPVIDGDTVYLVNGMGDALAIDARDGRIRWSRMLTDDRHEWGYAVAGAPAIAGDTLVVATGHDRLWALDAATGDGRWTWTPGDSAIYPVHYRGRARGFTGSPVITGDVVWAAASDGTLTALDLHSGEVLQSLDLGAPVLAGVAAAGELLVVAGWDGTVHGFAPGVPYDDTPPVRPRTPLPEITAAAIIALRLLQRRLARS